MNQQLTHPTRLDIKDVPDYLKQCRELVRLSGDAEAANHVVVCVKMLRQEISKLTAEIQVKQNFYQRTKNAHYAKEMRVLRAKIDYYTACARA